MGTLGVNLLYAAHFDVQSTDALLRSLFEGLTLERIEIDVVELSGPAFEKLDRKALGLRLVQGGYANAILYNAPAAVPPGAASSPPASEVLRKRSIILERGLFASEKSIHAIQPKPATIERLTAEGGGDAQHPPLFVCEMTIKPRRGESPAEDEFIRRIERLRGPRTSVLVTRFGEAYHLRNSSARRYTKAPDPVLRLAFRRHQSKSCRVPARRATSSAASSCPWGGSLRTTFGCMSTPWMAARSGGACRGRG